MLDQEDAERASAMEEERRILVAQEEAVRLRADAKAAALEVC